MPSERDKQIEELFARFAPGVGRYVLARLGDAELAEEITARVFLTVVRRFEQCRSSAAGWLWAIVASEIARHFRGRRHEEVHDGLAAASDPPPAQVERKEALAGLAEALDKLAQPQQTLIYMKYFQHMSNREIAESTGLSASNVGVMLHRATRQLREIMEP
ncbi:MAG: RNA polymerase sigma factor [Phycisphaerae bacterium]